MHLKYLHNEKAKLCLPVRGELEALQAALEEVDCSMAGGVQGPRTARGFSLLPSQPPLGCFQQVHGGLYEVHLLKEMQQELLRHPPHPRPTVCTASDPGGLQTLNPTPKP